MAGPSPGNRSTDLGQSPVKGIEVENNDVGEVFAMFVLTAKNNQFVPLVEAGSVS